MITMKENAIIPNAKSRPTCRRSSVTGVFDSGYRVPWGWLRKEFPMMKDWYFLMFEKWLTCRMQHWAVDFFYTILEPCKCHLTLHARAGNVLGPSWFTHAQNDHGPCMNTVVVSTYPGHAIKNKEVSSVWSWPGHSGRVLYYTTHKSNGFGSVVLNFSLVLCPTVSYLISYRSCFTSVSHYNIM